MLWLCTIRFSSSVPKPYEYREVSVGETLTSAPDRCSLECHRSTMGVWSSLCFACDGSIFHGSTFSRSIFHSPTFSRFIFHGFAFDRFIFTGNWSSTPAKASALLIRNPFLHSHTPESGRKALRHYRHRHRHWRWCYCRRPFRVQLSAWKMPRASS